MSSYLERLVDRKTVHVCIVSSTNQTIWFENNFEKFRLIEYGSVGSDEYSCKPLRIRSRRTWHAELDVRRPFLVTPEALVKPVRVLERPRRRGRHEVVR